MGVPPVRGEVNSEKRHIIDIRVVGGEEIHGKENKTLKLVWRKILLIVRGN